MSYSVEQTKKIQNVLLEIMKELHDFCLANNIKYYLDAGSVLGAVRHNGFIPWDDDMDIMMFREDYDKFISLAHKLPEHLYLQNPSNEKNCHFMYSKVRKKGTLIDEIYSKDLDYPKGFFVDIFPIDYVKKINLWFKFKMKLLYFFKKVYLYRTAKNVKGFKKIISYLFPKKVCCYFANKMVISNKKYDLCNDSFSTYHWKKQVRKVSDLGDGILFPFEKYEFYIPSNYLDYLVQLYGDWKKLPPEEKRGDNHSIHSIDFKFDDSKYFCKGEK